MSRRLVVGLVALVVVAVPAVSAAFKISEVTTNPGVTLAWPKRSITWRLHKKATGSEIAPGTPFDRALAAIETSFRTWSEVPCADISFTYGGPTDRADLGFDKDNRDSNINLLVFRDAGRCNDPAVVPAGDACHGTGTCADLYNCWEHDAGTYALTTTNFNIANGYLADVDIEFNATPGTHRYTAAPADAPRCQSLTEPTEQNCTATDVENTATHEIGHFIGIDHSWDSTATMYSSAQPAELSKRDLADDDLDAVCAIYPRWSAAAKEGGCASAGASSLALLSAISLVLLRNKRRTR